ncbi:MAG: DNA-3-methyladenine glycosylase I [Clostridia bacterium]|nr:DNA-3-methyladenine glycosylase I [Clostridia bacterium]
MEPLKRCGWCLKDKLYMHYHDFEWGVPLNDDRRLFEMLNLEGAQAGLSWYTVLSKRENYKKAFDGWDVEKIVRYDQEKVNALLQNPGIIRNKLKINAVIENAKAYLKVCEEFGSLDTYLWAFVEGKPIVNTWRSLSEIPAKTALSDKISKELQKKGFRFVGSTICYAFMQAVGMVDDHLVDCWKRSG